MVTALSSLGVVVMVSNTHRSRRLVALTVLAPHMRRGMRPGGEPARAYNASQCAAAVGAPHVALMFLTRAGLPYEALWAEWLGAAAGLLPAQHVQVRGQLL